MALLIYGTLNAVYMFNIGSLYCKEIDYSAY